MPQKKREIKYLTPNIIKSTSNVAKNTVQKSPTPITNNTVHQREIPLQNEVRFLPKAKKSRVFIIGGGTSLTGFDFSLLKDDDIIAVNKSIEYVPHAKYFITMDYTFITDPSKLTNSDFNIIKSKAENSYFEINKSPHHPITKSTDHPIITSTTSKVLQ